MWILVIALWYIPEIVQGVPENTPNRNQQTCLIIIHDPCPLKCTKSLSYKNMYVIMICGFSILFNFPMTKKLRKLIHKNFLLGSFFGHPV